MLTSETYRGPVRAWLFGIAALTLAVLVVGGVTRLTLSGLSIVEWDPLFGVIPPIGDAAWQAAFDEYKRFPDYEWRTAMSLAEFKTIYFWEYLHRLLARLIGVVFLVPFVWFSLRRALSPAMTRRLLVLFALGGLQGLMGWLMVASGLVDRPSVSHYRLAAHLSLAFVIFGYALWLARELAPPYRPRDISDERARRMMSRGLALVGAVLSMQIVWGALVAGLRAGRYYPTFPLMGGRLVPTAMLGLEPVTRNFTENPVAVQWTHRVLGTALLVLVAALVVRVFRARADVASRRLGVVLLGLIATQYALGVLTLVLAVPVSLGVLHQATALVTFGAWLWWLHHVLRSRVSTTAATARSAAIPALS